MPLVQRTFAGTPVLPDRTYADLLEETASGIADGTIEGKALIGGHPEVRAYFVRWHKAKHGHYIIYRASENGGIYVLRILHGRMDLPKYL